MSVSLSNSELKIFRDENDKYFTYLTGSIYNLESKENEGKFYTMRKIRFVSGKEVRNKSKIKVIDGFISPYKFKIKDENGNTKHLNGEIFFIKDFELVEDGVEEKQKPINYSKKNNQSEAKKVSAKEPKVSSDEKKLNSFSFNEYSNVTPF